jgi:hypothetical protein
VSEINRDSTSQIRILNETSTCKDGNGQLYERSVYWSELRDNTASQPKCESDYMRRQREEQRLAMPLFIGARS